MNLRPLLVTSILVILALLASFLPIQHAAAQSSGITFLVNNTADVADHTINGICSAGFVTGGPCTLRAAVMEAVAQVLTKNVTIKIPEGSYSLTIPPGYYNISPREGDLNIAPAASNFQVHITASNLAGDRPEINAGSLTDRIFEIGPSAKVKLTHLNLMNGVAEYAINANRKGGGIFNAGYLELENVVLFNNVARCAADNPYCTPMGGAIANAGSIFIRDSRITLNQAGFGSAIYSSGTGIVDIQRSLIFSNPHSFSAIYIQDKNILRITNSSISNNPGSSGSGQNLYVYCCADVHINSSTFVHRGSGSNIALGGPYVPTPSISIQDSILSSENRNCDDYAVTWVSGGYNIANDGSCTDLTGPGDLLNTDPMISIQPLFFGLDPVHIPLPGSPALNHRPGNCIYDGLPVMADQRGIPRADGRCDTGAFERNFPAYLPAVRR